MRLALNEPLHNIPDHILNKVVSKSIQADLRKYKMGTKAERVTRERTRSPDKRTTSASRVEVPDFGPGDLSKEVSAYLADLSSASQNKMSLIKMQVLKCDEMQNNFRRMRQCFNIGNLAEADRLLAGMDESNHQSILDL